MRHFLDEGGKGTQGFIEVIMDEIDDIRIDLAKKVLGYFVNIAYSCISISIQNTSLSCFAITTYE